MDCNFAKEPTSENCINFLSKFQYVDYLGSGGFGDTFLVKYNDKLYAMKVINLSEPEDTILHEIEILCMVTGLENYVRLIDYQKCFRPGLKGIDYPVIKRHRQEKESYYIIMEYCDTSLYSYLEGRTLSQQEFLSLVFQMVYGWNQGYQKFGLVHGDLHLQNILLKYDNNDRFYKVDDESFIISGPIVKISDFGTSSIDGDVLMDIVVLFDNISELFSHVQDPEEIDLLSALELLDENSIPEFLTSDLFLPLMVPSLNDIRL